MNQWQRAKLQGEDVTKSLSTVSGDEDTLTRQLRCEGSDHIT